MPFVIISALIASGIDVPLTFSENKLIVTQLKGFDVIKINEPSMFFTDLPGKPTLPYKVVRVAIPDNHEVDSVKIISFDKIELSDTFHIFPAQPPFHSNSFPVFVPPNDSIYNSLNPYPGELVIHNGTGSMGGIRIASFSVFPVQYYPRLKKIEYYTKMIFRVFISKRLIHGLRPLRKNPQLINILKKMIVNPDAISTASENELQIPQSQRYDYLIITNDSLAPAFYPLKY